MIDFNSLGNYEVANTVDLSNWLLQSVEMEGKSIDDITYVFCDDDYLYNINIKYLKHNTLTDIITFDYSEDTRISGDIFISIDRVRENASTYKINFIDELHRVMIHGVLHLCGHKDKTPNEKREMRDKEDYYLSLRTFN